MAVQSTEAILAAAIKSAASTVQTSQYYSSAAAGPVIDSLLSAWAKAVIDHFVTYTGVQTTAGAPDSEHTGKIL